MADEGSLLREVQKLVALRHEREGLQADAPFVVVNDDEATSPFVYGRGELLLAVNPSSVDKRYGSEVLAGYGLVYRIGAVSLVDGCLVMPGQSFAVLARG